MAATTTTKEFTLRLPQETADVLRNYAFVTGTSVNDLMKKALADYLQTHARKDAVEAAFQQVLSQHGVALDKLADL